MKKQNIYKYIISVPKNMDMIEWVDTVESFDTEEKAGAWGYHNFRCKEGLGKEGYNWRVIRRL